MDAFGPIKGGSAAGWAAQVPPGGGGVTVPGGAPEPRRCGTEGHSRHSDLRVFSQHEQLCVSELACPDGDAGEAAGLSW